MKSLIHVNYKYVNYVDTNSDCLVSYSVSNHDYVRNDIDSVVVLVADCENYKEKCLRIRHDYDCLKAKDTTCRIYHLVCDD